MSVLAQAEPTDHISSELPRYDPNIFISKKEYLCILKGKQFMEIHRSDKALALFEKAIGMNPSSIAHYLKGVAHEQAVKEWVQNWYRSYIEKSTGDKKKDQSLTLTSSDELWAKTHYRNALMSFEKAADIFPLDISIRYQCGRVALDSLQDLPKAGSYLLETVQKDSEQQLFRIGLARYYLDTKRFSEARKEAETIVNDSSVDIQSEAHFLLGQIESEQRNYSKAMEELKLSIALNPANYKARYHLAVAYEQNQQLELAKESYKLFMEINPSSFRELNMVLEAQNRIRQME